jgi:hypothetical protein
VTFLTRVTSDDHHGGVWSKFTYRQHLKGLLPQAYLLVANLIYYMEGGYSQGTDILVSRIASGIPDRRNELHHRQEEWTRVRKVSVGYVPALHGTSGGGEKSSNCFYSIKVLYKCTTDC